jgi:hypothetical protein
MKWVNKIIAKNKGNTLIKTQILKTDRHLVDGFL